MRELFEQAARAVFRLIQGGFAWLCRKAQSVWQFFTTPFHAEQRPQNPAVHARRAALGAPDNPVRPVPGATANTVPPETQTPRRRGMTSDEMRRARQERDRQRAAENRANGVPRGRPVNSARYHRSQSSPQPQRSADANGTRINTPRVNLRDEDTQRHLFTLFGMFRSAYNMAWEFSNNMYPEGYVPRNRYGMDYSNIPEVD